MGSTHTQLSELSYTHANSEASALELILTLNPHWAGPGNNIKFVRFTDGITNTVCPPRVLQISEPPTSELTQLPAPQNHQLEARIDGRTNRQ